MKSRGFTLLEMLVATLIMGIAVVALLSNISTSLRHASRVTDNDRAALAAKRKMDELLLDTRFSPRLRSGRQVRSGRHRDEWGLEGAAHRLRSASRSHARDAAAGACGTGDLVGERGAPAHPHAGGVSPGGDPTSGEAGGAAMKGTSARGVTLLELLLAVSLLGLLSVGMLTALRVGVNAMGKANTRLMDNRRMAGVQRILEDEIAGFMPVMATCCRTASGPPCRCPSSKASRSRCDWCPRTRSARAGAACAQVLEFQVIPGERGAGVRLVVNEHLYTGPSRPARSVLARRPTTQLGVQVPLFRPIVVGPYSFVLADRLAFCRFSYREVLPLPAGERWVERWITPRWPSAVRIDMAPIEAGAVGIQPLSIYRADPGHRGARSGVWRLGRGHDQWQRAAGRAVAVGGARRHRLFVGQHGARRTGAHLHRLGRSAGLLPGHGGAGPRADLHAVGAAVPAAGRLLALFLALDEPASLRVSIGRSERRHPARVGPSEPQLRSAGRSGPAAGRAGSPPSAGSRDYRGHSGLADCASRGRSLRNSTGIISRSLRLLAPGMRLSKRLRNFCWSEA